MNRILQLSTLLPAGLSICYFIESSVSFYIHFYEKPYRDIFPALLLVLVGLWLGRLFASRILPLSFLAFSILSVGLSLESDNMAYTLLSITEYNYLVFYLALLVLAITCSLAWRLFNTRLLAVIAGSTTLLLIPAEFVRLLLLVAILPLAIRFFMQHRPVHTWVFLPLGLLFLPWEEARFLPAQEKYNDKVIYSLTTRMNEVDVTKWRGHYWYFHNGKNQFSSIDYKMFYEPFAHVPFLLRGDIETVLLVGGENGLLKSELSRYGPKLAVTHLVLDSILHREVAEGSFPLPGNLDRRDPSSLKMLFGDPVYALESLQHTYDLIVLDIPDPEDLLANTYFTLEFYRLLRKRLATDGMIITQSLSPYLSSRSFQIIRNTLREAGFNIISLHNQVPTIGEWSWTLATVSDIPERVDRDLPKKLQLNWLNREAIDLIFHFGKIQDSTSEVNRLDSPRLMEVYLEEQISR